MSSHEPIPDYSSGRRRSGGSARTKGTIRVVVVAAIIAILAFTWYESLGHAEILNWFVDGINEDIAYGTCGFVFEEGSEKLRYGNHIHIPSDYRVLNSPDYVEWFWICL